MYYSIDRTISVSHVVMNHPTPMPYAKIFLRWTLHYDTLFLYLHLLLSCYLVFLHLCCTHCSSVVTLGYFTVGQLGPNFDPKFDPNLFPNLHEVGGKVGQLYCEKLACNLQSKVGTQSWVQVVVTTSIWVPT